MSWRTLTIVLGLAFTVLEARAQCPPSCPLPGGGSKRQDCHSEFANTALRLNYPHFDPAKPTKKAREIRCFDGEPGCDADGVVNNECRFDVDLCLLTSADPNLPDCTPQTVTAVTVSNPKGDPDRAALQTALNALLPQVGDVCTTGQSIKVPLKGDIYGRFRRGKQSLRVRATTAHGTDANNVRYSCEPHGWPNHGYDHANTRATPVETKLNPANASTLVPKWQLNLQALEGGTANGVTATPTVGNGLVYVSSWNGKVYAIKAATGVVKWRYDTMSVGILGSQSTPTLTADGRLVVGDSLGQVHCLDARTGALLWKTNLGGPTDHIWGGVTVANHRAFVGIASHSDQPCTQGRLTALDLDTGAPLWTRNMIANKICTNDVTISCNVDPDCGGGTCVPARGAGVTATVAVDPTGENVYADTVGCYTFPSNGDEDTIMKLDAATGNVTWKHRVQPVESFKACQGDGSINCVVDGDCGGAAPCVTKSFYHDFGFLNGPLLVDADDGMSGTRPLVVSASKDGTIYALDPDDGSYVWTRPVRPTPVTPGFAGFGLFNGAVGFANQRFHAALFDFVPSISPAPKHLMAFSPVDGSTLWEDDIGLAWSGVGLANGVLFTGTNAVAEFYAYDAALGTRLKTLTLPAITSSGASIVDGTVYVGYGIFGAAGGVVAFELP
jgi:outer membrane protein assembly factor BamB